MKPDIDFKLQSAPLQFDYMKTSATTPDGTYRAYHAHQGVEFLYVHSGVGRVIVDQKVHEIESGCLLYFQPFQLHRVEIRLDGQTDYIRTCLVFEPSAFDQRLKEFPSLRAFLQRLADGAYASPVLVHAGNEHMLPLLFKQYDRRIGKLAGHERAEEQLLLVMALLQQLRPYLKDAETPGTRVKTRDSHYVEQLLEWIESRYKEQFRLEHLARDMHLTPNYVSHLFRQVTGSSISEYLTARRMREACLLLKTTSYPIQDIAIEIGLTSVSYFIQLFKKKMGITPSQYRSS